MATPKEKETKGLAAEHSSAPVVDGRRDPLRPWASFPEITATSPDESAVPNEASNLIDSGDHPPMNKWILEACTTGDLDLFNTDDLNPDILSFVTPHGNNCLHIAAMLGHEDFAREVLSRFPNLLSSTNKDRETPLMAALMAANCDLASDMLNAASAHLQPDIEAGQLLNKMLLQTDERGDNALHHAIRNGFEDLAIQLLDKAPELSKEPNKIAESPMCMAARKGYSKVVERLLKISDSADSGPKNYSALHNAVDAGHTG